jgi:hypothetical protein
MRKIKSGPVIMPLCLLVVAMALMVIAGCVENIKSTPPDEEHYHVGKVLLLPIQNGALHHGEGNVVRCAVCGTSYMTGPVPAGAEAVFTKHLKEMLLKKKVALVALSNQEYEEARARVMLRMSGGGEKEILAAIGRETGADAVMSGTLYVYKQRVGSSYAADSPASVGFDLDLIASKNAHLIWNRVFEETQQALSENLLTLGQFVKRKGKWLTAEELAVSGLEEVLKSFPSASGT